jgi:hypothetical protein
LIEVWMGHRDFAATIEAGEITIEGDVALARAMPTWFRLNTFVEMEQSA